MALPRAGLPPDVVVALAGRYRAQVCHDRQCHGVGKVGGRHRGTWNAVAHDGDDVVIGFRSAEFAMREIDAGHLISFGAVADSAVGTKETSTVLDVDLREAVLAKKGRPGDEKKADQRLHSPHSI